MDQGPRNADVKLYGSPKFVEVSSCFKNVTFSWMWHFLNSVGKFYVQLNISYIKLEVRGEFYDNEGQLKKNSQRI